MNGMRFFRTWSGEIGVGATIALLYALLFFSGRGYFSAENFCSWQTFPC